MTAAERRELLKSWALDEGFDLAGVAELGPSENGRALLDWLARGDHADLAYMERRNEARLDPRRLFTDARSVLCVALRYHPLQGEPEPLGDLWPRVARYARGLDYHSVMGERLERLKARIEASFSSTRTRWYVDTGPVLERELAANAGIGVVGKNTNLLHPEVGSWFLLGEIFSTLEVEGDTRLADLCGSCSACLEACPTGALPEPYRLDSRRCISYWTIEHRGPIPRQARASLQNWVFGCDICQEVCPWNSGPVPSVSPELRLSAERADLGLQDMIALDREEYVARFRGSAMKRARRDGLRRNAAVAMGNSGDSRYVPSLVRALRQAEPLVAGHAAWALGQIGGPEAETALVETLRSATDGEVRSEARAALKHLGLSLGKRESESG